MQRFPWLLTIIVVTLSSATPAAAQQKVPNGAKVLMLSGGQRNHHAYRRQAQLLQKLMEDSGKFQVTICEDAAVLETEAPKRYDLIIAMADRRDPEFRLTEAQQRGILHFVHDGKGLFSLHGFCCADKTWLPEMRDMLGGVLAHFGTPDTKVKVGMYPVKIVDRAHPITHGLDDFAHTDELYYHLQTRGEIRPLVAALYEGQEWPILWTRTYGSGRVCVSVFGHCGVKPGDKDPLETPNFAQLILQALTWTASRS
jgi:type 1 glutamine amidotransferase